MTIMKRKVVLSLALGSLVALVFASAALATHPRPGGGSPLRVPFVPAFKKCAAPNSAHIAPLAFPSCTPPVLNSQMLKTGTTGAGAGFGKLAVYCTDNQTPPCTPNDANDTEDVKVDGSATDVQCSVLNAGAGCAAVGADYTGTMLVESDIRITDHSNGLPPTVCTNGAGNSPCGTATMTDITFTIPVPCVDNGGANGANCNISSTIDTLVPTAVKEFQRGVISVFGVRAKDQGPDGSFSPGGGATCPPICGSGDETTYADQGLFIP